MGVCLARDSDDPDDTFSLEGMTLEQKKEYIAQYKMRFLPYRNYSKLFHANPERPTGEQSNVLWESDGESRKSAESSVLSMA